MRLSPETKLILKPSQQMTSLDRSKYQEFYLKLRNDRLNSNDNRANYTIALFKKYVTEKDIKKKTKSPPFLQV